MAELSTHAHWNHNNGELRIKDFRYSPIESMEKADEYLTEHGFELIGSWLPANLGYIRLVTEREVSV